ncbi:MAG: proline--tRNA ligase [Clostridium sp.]|uniref:proline--tRNA ligase n=1 Tax=Clostridium sp. TaxID=1506 RepID=UPI0029083013|nr:proline--tRNA ligase [Clostridium sp.]MDU7338180.1 proline--tRNA ligase [Clostridium sp.]
MAEKKKLVEAITPMEEDFARWYTDIVKKAELMDYSSVRGCMVIEPYGFAIWENIRDLLDKRFKELGHQNVSMPMFIPESLLQKEKDHVEGFAPEVAWVTHGGSEELPERLCVRPTSETLFCDYYARKIQSWRDLPKLYNQWCSVVRWEKTTRPFLRSVEFHWQEGHTMHETPEEAKAETEQMLRVYAELCENELSIPVIKGRKTDKEKFAGAEMTYTIEAMMHDGKALQSGTSHYFGDGFAKAFDITFQGRDNSVCHPYQTSWGLSTRIIGGIIMTHGDNSGLVLPPAIAPIQVVIVPVAQHKEGVLEKARELEQRLKKVCRVLVDDSDQSPGWKFAQYEMKGVPIRLEIGPKDIEKDQCVLVRRTDREKTFVSLAELEQAVLDQLETVRKGMYEAALNRRESMTYTVKTLDEFRQVADEKPGFVKAMWCGSTECEDKLKELVGVTSRCMPFEQEQITETCVCCGQKAKAMVYWGKAY